MRYLMIIMLVISALITNAQVAEFFKNDPIVDIIYDVKLELSTVGGDEIAIPVVNFKVTTVFELYHIFEVYSNNYDDATVGDIIFSYLTINSKVLEYNFQNTDVIIATLLKYNPEEEHFDYLTETTFSDSEDMYAWLVGNGMKKK